MKSLSTNRLSSIDNLRGLIMIIMAVDHASFFVRRVHYSEFWGLATSYASITDFITRIVTHICAPGFFFLMGMGMHLFHQSRKEHGWSEGKIIGWFAKRGVVLILIQQFIENPAWIIGALSSDVDGVGLGKVPGDDGGPTFIVLAVLFSLGMSLILGSLFLRGKRIVWLISAFAVFGMSELIIQISNPETIYHPIVRILLIAGKTGVLVVNYPVLPWLGITLLGMYCTKYIREELRKFKYGGGVLLLIFLIYGMTKSDQGMVEFFSVVKYPPSIGFISFNLALIFGLLYFFQEWKMDNQILSVFGRVPMFFYLIHIWTYSLLGFFFKNGTSLAIMYLIWLLSLPLFYLLCRKYLAFSANKSPKSFWKLI